MKQISVLLINKTRFTALFCIWLLFRSIYETMPNGVDE